MSIEDSLESFFDDASNGFYVVVLTPLLLFTAVIMVPFYLAWQVHVIIVKCVKRARRAAGGGDE